MNESEVRLGENKRKIFIGVAVLVLAGISVLYFYFGVPDKDITQGENPVFQTTSLNFLFTPGEVKLANEDNLDPKNFVLANAGLEGRIVNEPAINGNLYEFVVAFLRADGDSVETTITLPTMSDNRVGVVVANGGIIADESGNITYIGMLAPEIIPLIKTGDPIQVQFYIHEVTDELRGQVMANPSCQESPENRELCRVFLDEMEMWYVNNSQLVEAVESGGELPENHRIGAVKELVIFDDK